MLGLIYNWFVNHGNPWFKRGGNRVNGTGSGVFAFGNDNGHANSDNSFRVVTMI